MEIPDEDKGQSRNLRLDGHGLLVSPLLHGTRLFSVSALKSASDIVRECSSGICTMMRTILQQKRNIPDFTCKSVVILC